MSDSSMKRGHGDYFGKVHIILKNLKHLMDQIIIRTFSKVTSLSNCRVQHLRANKDRLAVGLGRTLNLDISSKLWVNVEGIRGNPGEILHIGWKIHGV